MTYSRTKFQASSHAASTVNAEGKIAANRQLGLFDLHKSARPGSMNDASVTRATLVESIRKSGKSRDQIADEMSLLTGTEVTVRRLNGFTAESKEDYRFPVELLRAFCVATGDFALLAVQAEMVGMHLITETEFELLRLGREYLVHKRAEQSIRMFEKHLEGIEL